MKTIELIDTEARVTSVSNDSVELEWGGPDDRSVWDFDLAKLGGEVFDAGTNGNAGRTGWVVVYGAVVKVGDTIPLFKD